MTNKKHRSAAEWLDLAERAVRLLRPKFYNRLTWVVIISGLALLATPLWEAVLTSLIDREIGVTFAVPDRPGWGMALCVLGLTYHLVNTGFLEFLGGQKARERQLVESEHDRNIFMACASRFDEQRFWYFLETLKSDHSYRLSSAEMLDEFTNYLSREENMFLNEGVRDATENLLRAWRKLNDFLAFKFTIYPRSQVNGDFRACMTPGLNLDREGDGSAEQMTKYDELTVQLDDRVGELATAYEAFRRAVKLELVI